MKQIKDNVCQNIKNIDKNIKWVNCEFTMCFLEKKLITQEVLDNEDCFVNCIETNDLNKKTQINDNDRKTDNNS